MYMNYGSIGMSTKSSAFLIGNYVVHCTMYRESSYSTDFGTRKNRTNGNPYY